MKELGYLKELVSILTISAPIIDTWWKTTLKQVPCIWYPIQFTKKNNKDNHNNLRALINSGSEVNAIHPAYTTKLGLCARKIDVGIQKIIGSYSDIFKIVIINCSVKDKSKEFNSSRRSFYWLRLAWRYFWGYFFSLFVGQTYSL